jgi:hypothetical protein
MVLKVRINDRTNPNKEEALKEITKEKMVTLTVLVPESVKADLKIKAVRNKTTLHKLILNWSRDYINKEKG